MLFRSVVHGISRLRESDWALARWSIEKRLLTKFSRVLRNLVLARPCPSPNLRRFRTADTLGRPQGSRSSRSARTLLGAFKRTLRIGLSVTRRVLDSLGAEVEARTHRRHVGHDEHLHQRDGLGPL